MKKHNYIIAELVLCIVVFSFTACGKAKVIGNEDITTNSINLEEVTSSNGSNTIEDLEYKVELSSKDELFELKLYLDKDTYTKDEVINCYATLEYIGDEESITVYSGKPLVGFSLKDIKYFDGLILYLELLMPTTLTKGEVIRYDYVKSGGWEEDEADADFYREFYAAKELKLPVGTYEVTVALNCSFDSKDVLNSNYNNKVSASITVTE